MADTSDVDKAQSLGRQKLSLQTGKSLSQILSRISEDEFMETMHRTSRSKHFEDLHSKGCGQTRARKLLEMHCFEYLTGVIIVVNMFVMIVEIDRAANEEDLRSDGFHWTEIFGLTALLFFDLELSLRLVAKRCLFWRDSWNIFDFVVSVLDTTSSLVGLFAGDTFPVSILRVFRLSKLARVSKVVRVFPELRLLLGALFGSISAIFWGAILLMLWLLVWAMIAVLFIHPLNVKIDYDDCVRCPRAYSSVMQAALTFWQQIVTGDSWGEVTIPLLETFPVTSLFFIPVFLSVSVAVMNLILGVVVQVAQSAKENLEQEDNAHQALFKLEQQSHLFDLCRSMDHDGNGKLSYDEFFRSYKESPEFLEIMVSLNLTEEHLEIAWAMMDIDGSGNVSYKQLVGNLCKMKSSDANFMLSYIKYHVTTIQRILVEQGENQEAEFQNIKRTVEEEVEKIRINTETLQVKDLEAAHLSVERKLDKEVPACNLKAASVNEDKLDEEGAASNLKATSVNEDGLTVGTTSDKVPGKEHNQVTTKASQDSCGANLEVSDVGWKTFQVDAGSSLDWSLEAGESKNSNFGKPFTAANVEVQPWVAIVSSQIGALRLEITHKLIELDRKLGAQPLFHPGIDADITDMMSSQDKLELLTVPDKMAPCSMMPPCWRSPVTPRKERLRQSASPRRPQSDTAMMPLTRGRPQTDRGRLQTDCGRPQTDRG